MLYRAGKDIRNGFNAAVGVPRETGQIIFRHIIAEIVKEKEWVEIGRIAEAERPSQMDSRPFERRFGFDEPPNGSEGYTRLHDEFSAR